MQVVFQCMISNWTIVTFIALGGEGTVVMVNSSNGFTLTAVREPCVVQEGLILCDLPTVFDTKDRKAAVIWILPDDHIGHR